MTEQPEPPKGFITYRRDGGDRDENVRDLADSLRRDGFEVEIDQYAEENVLFWPAWMRNQLAAADFVLLICTADYREVVESLNGDELNGGAGVRWESTQIVNELYKSGHRGKFVPVLLEGSDKADIPYFLEGTAYYDLGCPGQRPDYEPLLRRVFSSPLVPAPRVGPPPTFSTSSGQQTPAQDTPWDQVRAPKVEALRSSLRQLVAGSTEDAGGLAKATITLAVEVVDTNPEEVVGLFNAIEKPLKAAGDKRLVLQTAELTIEAVRRLATKTQVEIGAEARAKVCGLSWVFQRRGELSKAAAFAEEARHLAERVDERATAAFAAKCEGRLARLLAEQCQDPEERALLYDRSRSLLEQAVQSFTAAEGFGEAHPEVGDCHSLLGRTWLSAGDVARAVAEAAIAKELLVDRADKDYLDLAILNADIARVSGRPSDAVKLLTETLKEFAPLQPKSYPRSEIVARMFTSRAFAFGAAKDSRRAGRDFVSAAGIYADLGERDLEVRSRAAALRVERRVLESLDQAVAAQDREIRDRVHLLYHAELVALGKEVRLRVGVSPMLVARLVRQAKLDAATQDERW